MSTDPLRRLAEAKVARETAEAKLRTLSSALHALSRLVAPPPPDHAYALMDTVERVDRVPTWKQIADALREYRETVAIEHHILEHDLTAEQREGWSRPYRTPC